MKPERLLKFFTNILFMTKNQLLEDRKRNGVLDRMLFTHFYITYSGESHYGVHTTLSKFFNKKHSTVIHYRDNHREMLRVDKLYKKKFEIINKHFNNGTDPFTTAYREIKKS